MILLNHNDLDALGCELCLLPKFNFSRIYHTNYADFEDVVARIAAENSDDKDLIVTDLCFSDFRESFKVLRKNFNIIHIDHHSYPDNFFENVDKEIETPYKYKSIIDTSKCAAMTCLDKFGADPFSSALINIIDAYDMWRETSPMFEKAQNLNDYFWNNGRSPLELAKFILDSGKLPDDYKEVVMRFQLQAESVISEMRKSRKIQRFKTPCPVTFVFSNEYFNKILLEEFSAKSKFVVGINKGIVRVRIQHDPAFFSSDLKNLKLKLAGNISGHSHAFSYHANINDIADLENECKRIVSALDDLYNADIPF